MNNKTISDKYCGYVQESKLNEALFSVASVIFILVLFFVPLFQSRFVLDLDTILDPYNYSETSEYREAIKSLQKDFKITDKQILLGGKVEVKKNFSVFNDFYNKCKVYKNMHDNAEKTEDGTFKLLSLLQSETLLLSCCAVLLIYYIINAIICFNGATLKNADSTCVNEYNKALNILEKHGKKFKIKYPLFLLVIPIALLTVIQARIINYNFFQSYIPDIISKYYPASTRYIFHFENFCGFGESTISYIAFAVAFIINVSIYDVYKNDRYKLFYTILFQSELNKQTESISNQTDNFNTPESL